MDLKEAELVGTARHPWELARLAAVHAILDRYDVRPRDIVDVGCGDGFVLAELRERLIAKTARGYDPELSRETAAILERRYPHVSFVADWSQLEDAPSDLLLLLDVLEHVAEPRELLARSLTLLAPGGVALVTVPAFQLLYSEHDRFLGHVRRYTRGGLLALVAGHAVAPVASGYLFGSLLIPRMGQLIREKALDFLGRPLPANEGVGRWRGPPLLTAAVTTALSLDSRVLLALSQRDVHLPGLSTWVLLKR